jgi:hypothetical protein
MNERGDYSRAHTHPYHLHPENSEAFSGRRTAMKRGPGASTRASWSFRPDTYFIMTILPTATWGPALSR